MGVAYAGLESTDAVICTISFSGRSGSTINILASIDDNCFVQATNRHERLFDADLFVLNRFYYRHNPKYLLLMH